MQSVTVLIVFLALHFSLFIFVSPAAADSRSRTINDSLVQNLECRNLNINNIYRAIREDAFDVSRNMPVKNWSFKSGAATIAGCWSLSRAQRMISYLARYNTSSDSRIEARVPTLLDMIRGATLIPWRIFTSADNKDNAEDIFQLEEMEEESGNVETQSFKKYWEQKLNNYKVFAVEDSNFSESKKKPGPSLWKALNRGYDQFLKGFLIQRSFREEIEAQQARLFFRLKNLKMIWKNGDRSAIRNQETAQRLITNLAGKRLTLIDLRMDWTRQHVVMTKSYKKISPELYEFKVYDSNAPDIDSSVFYNSHRHVFFAPEILHRVKDKRPYRNLGVFIVNEGDRGMYETAMLTHYRELCK